MNCLKKKNYDLKFRVSLGFPANALALKAMKSVFVKRKGGMAYEKRSHTEVSVKKNCLNIVIKAKDKSALKASLNSHLKLAGLAAEILEES